MTVSLTWIRDNYDLNGNRRIDTSELQQATRDEDAGVITTAQRDAVAHAWEHDTLLPMPTSEPVTIQWVSDHYDDNGNRFIDASERSKAAVDSSNQRISPEQMTAVQNAYNNRTYLPKQWVRVTYDTDDDCLISSVELQRANRDKEFGRITQEQLSIVELAHNTQRRLCPNEAKGSIVDISYPSSAIRGERVSIRAAVKNIGGEDGTFKFQLFHGPTRLAQSSQFTVAANRTSASKTMYVTTPGSGTSQSYKLKCVRFA